jgi:hypothetical protein
VSAQQAAHAAVDYRAEIITAVCAGVAVILGAIGTIYLKRFGIKAEEARAEAVRAAENIGTKNGRGDVVTMLEDLQDAVSALRTQTNTVDGRLLAHEQAVGRRLDGIHDAMKRDRNQIADVAGRVTRLEGGPT